MAAAAKEFSYLNTGAFAALLLIPSYDSVLKYAGVPGLIGFTVLAVVFLSVGSRHLLPALLEVVPGNVAMILVVVTFLFLIVVTAVGYPIANSGKLGGGSDIDDALMIGAGELLNGNYPYYKQTYLGGWLTPLPGALFLAIPFVATHLLPYQNIFWLCILFAVAQRQLQSTQFALGMLWTILLISPSFYQALLTGSDHISNSIYVLLGFWFVIRAFSDPESSVWERLWPAIFLGIGLSSRTNFIFITPLFFSVITQLAGWRTAVRYCSAVAVAFLLVTIPFWAYDPAGFSPVFVQMSKVSEYDTVFPYARYVIPATALGLAFTLSIQEMARDQWVFYRNAAIVQLYIILFTSVLYALKVGRFTLFLSTIGYGLFTLFFAIFALFIKKSSELPGIGVHPLISR